MAKQFRLHRGEVTLFRRPHDYDDGEEPLALPKEEADRIESLLRRHVFPIKIRAQQGAAVGKDITGADKPAAARMLDQMGLYRLGIEGAIQDRSRPFGDERRNRMVLQCQTDQRTGQGCVDYALHCFPERLETWGGMQLKKRFFDDRAEYRFRGCALHLNPFPHRSMI